MVWVSLQIGCVIGMLASGWRLNTYADQFDHLADRAGAAMGKWERDRSRMVDEMRNSVEAPDDVYAANTALVGLYSEAEGSFAAIAAAYRLGSAGLVAAALALTAALARCSAPGSPR